MQGPEFKAWRLSLPARLASGKRRRLVTQLDTARLLGVSGSTVNRWELHGVAPETEPMLRWAMAAILWGLPQWREVKRYGDTFYCLGPDGYTEAPADGSGEA